MIPARVICQGIYVHSIRLAETTSNLIDIPMLTVYTSDAIISCCNDKCICICIISLFYIFIGIYVTSYQDMYVVTASKYYNPQNDVCRTFLFHIFTLSKPIADSCINGHQLFQRLRQALQYHHL